MKHPLAPLPSFRRAHVHEAHPLLGTFPLTVMALATVLVLFALTMTWLNAGEDSPLRTSTSVSLLVTSSGAPP